MSPCLSHFSVSQCLSFFLSVFKLSFALAGSYFPETYTPCDTAWGTKYLNTAAVQKALGVDGLNVTWSECSDPVGQQYSQTDVKEVGFSTSPSNLRRVLALLSMCPLSTSTALFASLSCRVLTLVSTCLFQYTMQLAHSIDDTGHDARVQVAH